ncbi:MAG: sulfatase, partial [Gemmatimonadota bacterium]
WNGAQVPFAAVVALGAALGGLAGMAESAHLALRHLIEGNLARSFSWDIVWMAPASAALVFGLLAVLLAIAFPVPRDARGAALQSGRFGLVALTPCLFVLAVLAAYSVLQDPHFGLYRWSAWLLSLGLAVLAVRAAAGPRERTARVMKWTPRVVLPAVALLVIGGLWDLPVPRERRALAALAAADAGQPNVLLLVLDTVRAASLGLYDPSRHTTPNLERLATRGTVFDWAIATAPWTLPSHASMFTGVYPTALEVDYNVPLAEHHLTLAEVLRDRGYATAGFVANMAYATRISGLAQGFARYEDWPMTWGRFIESSWFSRTVGRKLLPLSKYPWRGARRKNAEENVDDFLHWLDARRGPDRPFFAFLNFIDAHDPYATPPRLRARFEPPGPPVLRKREHITEADLASTRASYEASIALIDEQLGRLVGELEQRKLFEHTLIIVVSDHGEQFGEHGLQFHGNSLYLPLIHVPLMLVYPPTVPGGVRVRRPVSLRDLSATVMQVVTGGLDGTLPGRSILDPALQGDTARPAPLLSLREKPYQPKRWEPSVGGSLWSVFQYPYHLIRDSRGRQELYRVDLDPAESQNLVASADSLLLMGLGRTLDSLASERP